ncbi:MAG: HEAT repeat domain-containing protein [Anaerolineae bacterium]|jgi:hypothetical protein|nr:HEAT repeat domain-containing protein [Anaerolineae bacterium]
MIDPRILQALSSSDSDKRKKAVAYLAKSLDRDALPHLARVYKTDSDPEIRELAKKAGAYIQKNAPQASVMDDEEEADDESYSRYNNLYADDDEDDEPVYTPSRRNTYMDDDDEIATDVNDDIPLPSNIQVSAVAEERAKSFVEQAMDWNVRGNNNKAVEMLKKAFRTNPRLAYDSYTMGLAMNITGLSSDDTKRLLSPSAKEMQKMGVIEKSAPKKLNAIQQFFALVIFIGATASLIGFFALPWIDFGWIPVEGADQALASGDLAGLGALGVNVDVNNLNTVGGSLSEVQKVLNTPIIREVENAVGFGEEADLVRQLIGGLRSVRSTATGLDTTLYMIGTQDVLRSFGFGGLLDFFRNALNNQQFLDSFVSGFTEGLGSADLSSLGLGNLDANIIRGGFDTVLEQLRYTPQAVDFSVIAVPVAASVAFLLGLLLLLSPSGMVWFLCIVFGLAGVGACAYFYTTAISNLMVIGKTGLNVLTDLPAQGLAVTSATQFIGLGFWVTMGGLIAVALSPFLGLLFAPGKQE